MGFHTLHNQNEILSEQIETLQAELLFQIEARADAEAELHYAWREMELLNRELQEIIGRYQNCIEEMNVAAREAFTPFLEKISAQVVFPIKLEGKTLF